MSDSRWRSRRSVGRRLGWPGSACSVVGHAREEGGRHGEATHFSGLLFSIRVPYNSLSIQWNNRSMRAHTPYLTMNQSTLDTGLCHTLQALTKLSHAALPWLHTPRTAHAPLARHARTDADVVAVRPSLEARWRCGVILWNVVHPCPVLFCHMRSLRACRSPLFTTNPLPCLPRPLCRVTPSVRIVLDAFFPPAAPSPTPLSHRKKRNPPPPPPSASPCVATPSDT